MHLLGLIGATIIFTWSPLFAKIRSWYPMMLECAMCVGFWVGCGDYLRQFGLFRVVDIPEAMVYGAAVSVLSFGTSLVLETLQRRLPKD